MSHVLGPLCKRHPELNGLRLSSKRRTGGCVQCGKDANRRHYAANIECIRAKHRDYARDNLDKNTERAVAWAKSNRERHNTNCRSWNAANREKANGFHAAWSKAHPDRAARVAAKYRASKTGATPQWGNKVSIAAFYAEARRLTQQTGLSHHVDHIVPINHPRVCGLHVESNLQVLLATDNVRKGNRHWPEALSA